VWLPVVVRSLRVLLLVETATLTLTATYCDKRGAGDPPRHARAFCGHVTGLSAIAKGAS
jgi:hypothetical protein